ncbi:MAG: hypothetical protein D6781_08360, partial [Verrucomicrobia bacterium]
MNQTFLKDWAGVIYADALKQGRPWNRADGSPAIVNQFGHPTEAASSYLSGSYPLRAGTYRVYHDGQLDISFSHGTLGSFSTDPATGLKVATWTLPSRTSNVRMFVDNVVTAPTVLSIMRPIDDGSSTSHDFGELPDRLMDLRLGGTEVMRFMDPLDTNGNDSEKWEFRVRPDEHPRTIKPQGGEGMPWEHIIAFCNQMGISPFINIPVKADDEYIRNVAKVFRYGSNGTDPFNSDAEREAHRVAGGTVWEPLDPSLALYIEYSNEVWNNNSSFSQTAWLREQALTEAEEDPNSPLVYDGVSAASSNAFDRLMLGRAYTRRVVFISNTFREVFGDDQMMTRVRPFLFWQKSNANSHGSFRLAFLEDFYGTVRPGNPVAHPPSYYVWGGGTQG